MTATSATCSSTSSILREGRLHRAERRLGVAAASKTLTRDGHRAAGRVAAARSGRVRGAVTDAAGQPVRAQVSLAVIDEAVYGVKPDDTPDPIRFFYRREYSRVATTFSSSYYFTGYSGRDRLQLARRGRRPFTLADFKGDQPVQAQVRKDFPDAIHWVGDLVTDAQGRGRIAVTYPDALTTWRLTARAITEDTRAGTTIARTTTTKDLIVRVITPRFLTEGDEVVVPTMVHNYTDGSANRGGVDQVDGSRSRSARMPAPRGTLASGAERRDDWRFAAKAPGAATVTATATTESDVDAVELPIPILPFGIRREVGIERFGGRRRRSDVGRHDARRVESGGAIDLGLAGAVARRLAARRARLPDGSIRTAAPSRRSRASCPTCWSRAR